MSDPVKRLHYFDHQFLRVGDFTDEQQYHIAMRRAHNRLLHTWGVADGLDLSFTSGASRLTVGTGTAFDGVGREIVLPADQQTPDLSGLAGKTMFVTIGYDEQLTDQTSETGIVGETRWTESPLLGVDENPPDDPSLRLVLGRVTVGADGRLTGTDDGVDPNRRRSAGVVGGDLDVRSLTLGDPSVDRTRWPRMRLGAPSRADLDSGLKVTGNIDVSGTVDGRDVSGDGTHLDQHVGATNNPHGTTAAQVGAPASVDGVSNPGGNIDLVPANAVTITPDDGNNRITIGDTHSTRADNPHGTTAAQIGALPLTGGTVSGGLTVNGGIVIPDNSLPGGKVQESSVPSSKLAERPGLARAWGAINGGTLAWGWNVVSVAKQAVGVYRVQLAGSGGGWAHSVVPGGVNCVPSVLGRATDFTITLTNFAGGTIDGLVYFICFYG
jgi:hypothetical protein